MSLFIASYSYKANSSSHPKTKKARQTLRLSGFFEGSPGRARTYGKRIYILAPYTGLRAGEIASLQLHSFDFESSPTVVKVAPSYTKNSEAARIPLRKDLVEVLNKYLVEKEIGSEVVWPGTWSEDGAKMIRVDLAGAGIEYTQGGGCARRCQWWRL